MIGQAKQNEASTSGEEAAHPAMRLLEPFYGQKAIDLTVFMGQWPTRLQIQADAGDLSVMADRFGLSGMCVSHIASLFGFDTRSGNEELFRESASDERLWPYAILNPAEEGWEQELDWAVKEGARGIRLAPGYHQYSLQSPQVEAMIARVRSHGLPLHVCIRIEDERLVHPRFPVFVPPFHEIAEFLKRCSGMPVILGGLRAREWSQIHEHFDEGHDDKGMVLLDLWFTNGPLAAIVAVSRSRMTGRFGYGSCAPIQVPEATVIQLAAANISESERIALCRGNAARLFGTPEL